jgi:hypothetical protein
MSGRRLRELRDGLIKDLDLPQGATTETVCTRLVDVMAQRLGREIRLRFDDLGGGEVSGLWAVTDAGVHVIIVTTARSWFHRLHILLHEIAHMLCGHEPMRLSEDHTRALFYPDLGPGMLRILAGRTTLSRRDEREADELAGALAQHLFELARQPDASLIPPDGDNPETRIWYTMAWPSKGRQP